MISEFLGEIGVKSRRVCPKERLPDLGRVVAVAMQGIVVTRNQDDKKMTGGGRLRKKDE
jgi:hypothetical protein